MFDFAYSAPFMTDIELRRLSALRSELEGFAAREAARRIAQNGGALADLREILGRLAGATLRKDYTGFREADYALHAGIVRLAEVPRLFESWQGVWEAQQAFHERTFEECFPDARFLAQEHEHLVETLALGDPVAAEDAARSHLGAVWFRLDARGQVADAHSLTDPLQRAVAHLGFSLHRPLRLAEVARRVAFTSAGHLSRLFRQHYGESFQAYLQSLRLQKAEELLRESRLPVASISRRVGYRDVSRFGQHFKRRFGKSPVRYRDSFQRP
jgi:AraC-like DNA-binding protein